MNHLFRSKWTSVNSLNGCRHYEVQNVLKNKKVVEMFCVCENEIKVSVPIKDLKDNSKWLAGWLAKDID